MEVSLLTGFGREDEFIAPILASAYRRRLPDAAAFARKNRVLLLDSPQGVPIDIALAAQDFDARWLARNKGRRTTKSRAVSTSLIATNSPRQRKGAPA